MARLGYPYYCRIVAPHLGLNGLGSSDFNEFVEKVIHARPGFVSEMYFSFIKNGITHIGKHENLSADLTIILDSLDVKYDSNILLNSAPVNVSMKKKTKLEWDKDLKSLVTKLELPALLHFDYITDSEREELGIVDFKARHPALLA